jgi:hypothetical protein
MCYTFILVCGSFLCTKFKLDVRKPFFEGKTHSVPFGGALTCATMTCVVGCIVGQADGFNFSFPFSSPLSFCFSPLSFSLSGFALCFVFFSPSVLFCFVLFCCNVLFWCVVLSCVVLVLRYLVGSR